MAESTLKQRIKEEYKKCLTDPIYFIKKYVKIQHPIKGTILFELYDFQEQALSDIINNNKSIILKARQMGISTLVAAYCIWLMTFHSDKTILCLSITQETAKEIVTRVRFANDNLPVWLKVIPEEDNRLSLKLKNGSSIKAASSAGTSGRSAALSLLILDEAAHIDGIDEIWISAQPTLSCLKHNQLVLTDIGLKRIGSFITDSTKIGFNILDNTNVYSKDNIVTAASSFYKSEKDSIYKVKFGSGDCVFSTQNHPLMTKSGWKVTKDLIPGEDAVLCIYGQNSFGPTIDYSKFNYDAHRNCKLMGDKNSLDLAYLYGLWIAEGHFVDGGVGITNTEPEIENFIRDKFRFKKYDDRHHGASSTELKCLMEWIGCGGTAHTKKVPDRILSSSRNEQVRFLQGLFDGDGCAMGNGNVKLTSVSFELLSNVRTMLLNFGIRSFIRDVVWKSTKSTVIKDKTKVFCGFELHINGWDAHKYYNDIGFGLIRKQSKRENLSVKSIKRIYADREGIKRLIYKSGRSIRGFANEYKCSLDRYLWYGGGGLSITSVETILRVCDPNESDYINLKLQYKKDTSEFWDTVESVDYHETDFSYDLKVPDGESFIANGYINHNTGGKAIILSTPNGVGNFFHKTWVDAEGKKNEFKTINLPWHLHPDRDQKWRDDQTALSGVKKSSQEFDCDFLTTGNTVVDPKTIEFYKTDMVKPPIEIRGSDQSYWIWAYPDYSKSYLVSADVARGDASDFSTFQVIELEGMTQVAEFQSHLGTTEFGNLLVGVATEYNSALLIVENPNMGWAVLQQIINRGYQNLFYSSSDLQYIDVESQMTNRHNQADEKLVPGFTTTSKTKPLIVSRMEMYFRDKVVNIHSTRLINELSTFVWNGNQCGAMPNHHDDLVMSLSIGLWVRDTALKLRQQSIAINKSMVDSMRVVGLSGGLYVASNKPSDTGWSMNTGGRGGDKKESLLWLL